MSQRVNNWPAHLTIKWGGGYVYDKQITEQNKINMNEYDVKRLALVLAIQAEIEGMKAENDYRKVYGHELTYNEGHFQEQAERLRTLANSHNDQL